jgi:peptidoglycan/LPS O-acetylase OafA/YrhL
MKLDTWPKHLYALDVSRGIALFAVILWHWQHFAFNGGSLIPVFVRESQPLYPLLRLAYEAGSIGARYFFLLSGFVFFWLYRESIHKRAVNAWTFGVRRFSRLYPLHLVTLLGVALLQLLYVSRIGVAFVYTSNDLYHFFLNVSLAFRWGFEESWSFNAPAWTVSVEALLYIIFFSVALLGWGGWRFCLVVALLAFAGWRIFYHEFFEGLVLFFLGGLTFYLTRLASTKQPALKRPIYLGAILCWAAVIVNYYFFDITSLILKWGATGEVFIRGFPFFLLFPLTVCSLALIEIDKGPWLRSLAWIGEITYSAYLLHFPLQLVFVLAASYGLLNPDFYLNPLYMVLYLVLLVALAYGVFRKFELPMQSMIRRRWLRSQGSEAVRSDTGVSPPHHQRHVDPLQRP